MRWTVCFMNKKNRVGGPLKSAAPGLVSGYHRRIGQSGLAIQIAQFRGSDKFVIEIGAAGQIVAFGIEPFGDALDDGGSGESTVLQ